MQTSLLSFNRDINALRHHLTVLNLEAELLALKVDAATSSTVEKALERLRSKASRSTFKRRFDYNGIIVSLYGIFEQYIESLLRSYVVTVNDIVPEYGQLPLSIQKKHIELSYQLITRIQETRYKAEVTPEQIVANLHSCMSNADNYIVNADAYAYHSANFRRGILEQTCAQVGVDGLLNKIKRSSRFTAYLKSIDSDRLPDTISVDEAFLKVDELADRRNDVAHGIISELLSFEILESYIDFFEAFGEALYEVFRRETLPFLSQYRAIPLGSAIKVINNCIVCISVENVTIKQGDYLLARLPKGQFVDGEIEEIQVNKVTYPEIKADLSTDIALKVPFKAKNNQSFFLLPNTI